jgi:Lipoprotein LpqB beta-propeller domain
VKRAVAVAALLLTLLAGGCGIPDDTDVRTLRPGPSGGITAGAEETSPQKKRDDTNITGEFVRNYLAAAAGDFEGAVARVKEFMAPEAAAKFKPGTDLMRVVRLAEDPLVNPSITTVTVKVREVGNLRQNGILEPSSDPRVTELKFEVGSLTQPSGLFVLKAPPVLLLTDEALRAYYEPRTIYFWDQDDSGLIPDVRYLAREVPSEQVPTQILDWLTSGPAPWLTGVAEALPEGTKLIGNVPAISNETLQIQLSGQAVPPEDPAVGLDRLQKQLRWSLRPQVPATLQLIIEHSWDEKYSGTDYYVANPAYRPTAQPERFVVYDGQIRRLSNSYDSGSPVPLVRPQDNKNVRMAALAVSGARGFAALVVENSNGVQSLRVGAAGAGEFAGLSGVGLPAPIGRPVWAKSAEGAGNGTTGLITAAGRLYSFTPDGRPATEVQWQGTRPAGVTAVAVAPDAHRAAVIAGGNLYIAALSRSEDGVQLMSPHIIRTTDVRSLSAVEWSSESALVVAGRRTDNRVATYEVSVDGVLQTARQDDLGQFPVTYMASLPDSPIRSAAESTGAMAYEQNGIAYDEEDRRAIGVGDLAAPVTNPPAGVRPRAPFFLS